MKTWGVLLFSLFLICEPGLEVERPLVASSLTLVDFFPASGLVCLFLLFEGGFDEYFRVGSVVFIGILYYALA